MSISPRKSSTALCPADQLFYKGQLLPLHTSPRLSMVRTLLSTSSAADTAAAARDSSGSSNDSHSLFTASSAATDCDSSRPSSVTEDDELKRFHFHNPLLHSHHQTNNNRFQFHREMKIKITNKYHYLFSLSRFSSVFRKEPGSNKTRDDPDAVSGSSIKRVGSTAREVVRKYLKKVKPLYEKISPKQQQHEPREGSRTTSFSLLAKTERSIIRETDQRKQGANANAMLSHSFSGNLRFPAPARRRRRSSCVSSCPSSTRSSPSHSGALSRGGFAAAGGNSSSSSSTMEELQSAIQGAIAHCKNSWIQNKSTESEVKKLYVIIAFESLI
ncbi:putative membrane-associated kinase regulator 1 [Senna tora]|uniref:Putative membrane-associated kinase regulator 1 n=1 Tax=Senna tora TaxID=362788 RepID=A0A834SLU2_9FABA|nr:putative membrane-associated kinase regulator 1 [Senna tora]